MNKLLVLIVVSALALPGCSDNSKLKFAGLFGIDAPTGPNLNNIKVTVSADKLVICEMVCQDKDNIRNITYSVGNQRIEVECWNGYVAYLDGNVAYASSDSE